MAWNVARHKEPELSLAPALTKVAASSRVTVMPTSFESAMR